jgi:hypothetical protein
MAALLQGEDGPVQDRDSDPCSSLDPWQTLARRHGLPLLPLLALAQEQQPLLASLRTLVLMGRC